MGIRVDHYQTPSDETHKVVNVFDKKNLVPWNIFPDNDNNFQQACIHLPLVS